MPRGRPALAPSERDWEIARRYLTPLPDGSWEGAKSIAVDYGVVPQTIRNTLIRCGVALRDQKAAHSNGKRCKPITRLPAPGEESPPCKCGCGAVVAWNQRKDGWNLYVVGHYRPPSPHKDAEWLRRQYVNERRTIDDIAAECGVRGGSVRLFMLKFGIERRDKSEARMGRKVGPLNHAWKGGIAKWPYASNWKAIARRIRKRDNYTCQMCQATLPKSSKLLHVHHKDGDKINNADENLVTVCATCHPRGKRKEGWRSKP
jgi:hypothetical protein